MLNHLALILIQWLQYFESLVENRYVDQEFCLDYGFLLCMLVPGQPLENLETARKPVL